MINDTGVRDDRKPAVENDEEEKHINRGGFAGPEGQDENDSPVKIDGGEVSGQKPQGEGRKPAGGAA